MEMLRPMQATQVVCFPYPPPPTMTQIHAEQCLLVNCLHHGESSIKALAVSAAPCGHCRQFYSELVDAVRHVPGARLLGGPYMQQAACCMHKCLPVRRSLALGRGALHATRAAR